MTQNTCFYKTSSIVKSNPGITRKYTIPIATGSVQLCFIRRFLSAL